MEPIEDTWEEVAKMLAHELGEVVMQTMFRDVEIRRLNMQIAALQYEPVNEEGPLFVPEDQLQEHRR